jgi:hypothetical protein
MKTLLFWFILFLALFPNLYAETGEIDTPEDIVLYCSNMYEIRGNDQVEIGSTHEYRVISRFEDVPVFSGTLIYTLSRDEKVVEEVTDEKYLRNFKTAGQVLLTVKLSNLPICEWVLTKNIRVYSSTILYLWEEVPEIEIGIKDVFEKNWILFRSYRESDIVDDGQRWEFSEALANTDILIVGSADLLSTFSEIVKLQKWKLIDFASKKIFIRSDYSRQFLSKLLAFSLSQIGSTRAYIVTKEGFYGLITRLSTGNSSPEESLGQELSYEKTTFIWSLWWFLQYLSYSWFSYSLIAFLLVLTTVVLILNVIKQIVWLNVFGIYYPILFAIVLSILGPASLSFIMIGFFSILLVNLFTRKVHLLINAKRALLISLYIFLFLFLIGIDNFFELKIINYTLYNNNLIIFPIFIAIILADKIFQDDIDIGTRVGLIDFLQYSLITAGIYFLLQNKSLQYFLISYPDIIIWIVILNIIVGRYMWLQILEYFRFSPLLRRLHDTEEE